MSNILDDINSLIEEIFVLPPMKKSEQPSIGGGKPLINNRKSAAQQPRMREGMQQKAAVAPKAMGAVRSENVIEESITFKKDTEAPSFIGTFYRAFVNLPKIKEKVELTFSSKGNQPKEVMSEIDKDLKYIIKNYKSILSQVIIIQKKKGPIKRDPNIIDDCNEYPPLEKEWDGLHLYSILFNNEGQIISLQFRDEHCGADGLYNIDYSIGDKIKKVNKE